MYVNSQSENSRSNGDHHPAQNRANVCRKETNKQDDEVELCVEIGNNYETLDFVEKEIREVHRRQSNRRGSVRYAVLISLGIVIGAAVSFFCFYFWDHLKPDRNNCQQRVVGYYYGSSNRTLTDNQISKVTHVIFRGMKLNSTGNIDFESDEKRSLFLNLKKRAKEINPNLKTTILAESYGSTYYNSMFSSKMELKSKRTLMNSISSFIHDHEIDGVELSFASPMTFETGKHIVSICQSMKKDLDGERILSGRTEKYILSVSLPQNPVLKNINLQQLLDCAQFINIRTDDNFVDWYNHGMTAPLAPLYASSYHKKIRSIDKTIQHYTCKTKMPSQLNMVLPFYGKSWENVNPPLSDEMYRNVNKVNESIRGDNWAWRSFGNKGWNINTATWHNESASAYIYDSKTQKMLTFDNERSLKEKMMYAKAKHLGGVTIYSLEFDDDDNSLLNAVTSVDLCSDRINDNIEYNCDDLN